MITFEPSEEQRMMRDTVFDFAKSKLRPRLREVEAARALPDDLRDGLVELGLGGLATPEAHGGSGVSARTAVLIEEELGWGDAGAAYAIPGPGHLAHALVELADDAQRARLFAPFASDPLRVGAIAWSEARPNRERPGFTTIAKRDGDAWALSGKKSYVLGAGRASTYVVFAQIDEAAGWDGIGAFVVDASATGVEVGERYATVGLDAAAFGEVSFDGVRVADEDRLLGGSDFRRATLRMFARVSLHAAARAVGVARAAFELAREFADERKAFGKPIGHFQSIAFLLADRLMDVDGARGLVWRAAWTLDVESSEKEPERVKKGSELELLARCAEAFAEASEIAIRCGEDGIQVHGGAGFVRDVIAEKLFRDARQIALAAPSATTSDQLFAALALGAPLDPSAVLPTPEIQPIFT
jgi:alkylation response protein AidB-like acyl-CoA dehydrogenase